MVSFREIVERDIQDLFIVRTRTHQNCLTLGDLHELGITEESVKVRMQGTYKGWLCEVDGQMVGFAMGDRATGELWVIAVLPEYIGFGIGARLLALVEGWLAESGCTHLWLTTDKDPSLKAYGFYRAHGWKDDRIEDGVRYMEKKVA